MSTSQRAATPDTGPAGRRVKRRVAIMTALSLAGFGAGASLTLAVEPEERIQDRPLDFKLSMSPRRPPEKAIADIRAAHVRSDGDAVVFEATLSSPLPRSVAPGYFDVYWDIDGDTDWRLTASVESRLYATLVSAETGSGKSTSDGSLPAQVTAEGAILRVRLDASAVEGFPQAFRWKLTTRLNMQAAYKGVGVLYDFAPEGRFGNYHL